MLRVTEAIARVGLIDTTWFTEESRQRGTDVHALCHEDDVGDIDFLIMDDEITPYLESWRGFRKLAPFRVLDSEFEVVHETMGYVGHPDRLVSYDGRIALLDLKTGPPSPSHGIQLALYALALASDERYDMGVMPLLREGIYLKSTGAPATRIAYTDRKDFEIAKAVITLAHWIGGEDK